MSSERPNVFEIYSEIVYHRRI